MCIIIVIAIIVGNIVTQNYTVKSIGILSEELEELKKRCHRSGRKWGRRSK